jgi:hypothetical protein
MRELIWFSLALLLSCLPALAVTLVKDGRPAASIVLPAKTEFDGYAEKKGFTDEEKLAAEELQLFIEKISGAKLPIVTADAKPQGATILLGAELARGQGLGAQIDKLDEDGLICTVKGNALILTGQRARGALYAAYTFLESLGCRWVFPGPAGEIYPSLKTIDTSINITQNPSHSQRYWWCTYGNGKDYPQWVLRNKGNFSKAPGDVKIAQGHALAGPLRWGASQERYREKFTDADGKEAFRLPEEYFAMEQGKPNRAVPNMSNPKAVDLYVDFYTQQLRKNPREYISISAEDGFVNDERPESRKLDSAEFDYIIGAPSATDRLLNFHNRVISRVTKEFPDAKFGMLVYANNTMPPRLEGVHPNLALIFAPLSICPLHHVRDDKCKTNREYRQWFEDWMRLAKAAGAETYYYDYEPMGYCWNVAMINPRWGIIGKNYPWFHQLGLDGHTTQGFDDWASCGLNNYLMQRFYWDATLDYKAVIADYSKARFGAAAPAMIEYFDILEARMDEIPDMYSNEVWDNHLILTKNVRKKGDAQIERARRLADTPTAKAHVEMMADLQASTNAMCDAIEYGDATGDFGKAAQMMEKCFEIKDRLNKIYTHYMSPARMNQQEKAQYLTGGMWNQYKEIAAKIDGSKAKVVLPRAWKGNNDTRQQARPLGWYQPETKVDHLDDLDITVCPDVKYGTQREVAAFFYRTEVNVPQDFAGKEKITLYFPGLIAKAMQIWVNGQPVTFDVNGEQSTIWRGPTYFWINYDHQVEFDITPYVKAGQKNTLAFRVFKSYDFGGSYRRVWLLGN